MNLPGGNVLGAQSRTVRHSSFEYSPLPSLATTSLILPLFHYWQFSTGPGGDFASLAKRLERVPPQLPATVGNGFASGLSYAADRASDRDQFGEARRFYRWDPRSMFD